MSEFDRIAKVTRGITLTSKQIFDARAVLVSKAVEDFGPEVVRGWAKNPEMRKVFNIGATFLAYRLRRDSLLNQAEVN